MYLQSKTRLILNSLKTRQFNLFMYRLQPSYLSCGFNSPDATHTDHYPGREETQDNPPLEISRVIDACWGVQRHSVPVVVLRWAQATFWHWPWTMQQNKLCLCRCGCTCVLVCVCVCLFLSFCSVTCLVFIERALCPWQGILEGVKQVPHDPGHDSVVVESHKEGH